MNNRTLVVLAGALSLGELGSAAIIWRENYPDSQPLFAVLFAALFLIGAALLRAGRVGVGAAWVGLLCLFELVTFPTWTRHGVLDWTYQCGYAALALAGLVTAVVVFVHRQTSSKATSVTS